MNKKVLIISISAAVLILGFIGYKVINRTSAPSGVEVDWRLLGEMDYITGKVGSELKALNGEVVKIPGFMVPLEDEAQSVTEFLLVPSPQACIHVPAPPPNQMVYVKMKRGTEAAIGPIWVYGKLNITTKKSIHGDSSFELTGERIEPYK